MDAGGLEGLGDAFFRFGRKRRQFKLEIVLEIVSHGHTLETSVADQGNFISSDDLIG